MAESRQSSAKTAGATSTTTTTTTTTTSSTAHSIFVPSSHMPSPLFRLPFLILWILYLQSCLSVCTSSVEAGPPPRDGTKIDAYLTITSPDRGSVPHSAVLSESDRRGRNLIADMVAPGATFPSAGPREPLQLSPKSGGSAGRRPEGHPGAVWRTVNNKNPRHPFVRTLGLRHKPTMDWGMRSRARNQIHWDKYWYQLETGQVHKVFDSHIIMDPPDPITDNPIENGEKDGQLNSTRLDQHPDGVQDNMADSDNGEGEEAVEFTRQTDTGFNANAVGNEEEDSGYYYFSQLLNHFQEPTTNSCGTARQGAQGETFQQFYQISSEFYKPGGPIILWIPGESPLHALFLRRGLAYELANATSGLLIALEHRFYGSSIPRFQDSAAHRERVKVDVARDDSVPMAGPGLQDNRAAESFSGIPARERAPPPSASSSESFERLGRPRLRKEPKNKMPSRKGRKKGSGAVKDPPLPLPPPPSQAKEGLPMDLLKYLSVDQAIEDIAYFMDHFAKIQPGYFSTPNQGSTDTLTTRWILAGCSYGGNLAAWTRQRYPDKVFAAYASSAPVRSALDFFEYSSSQSDVLGKECSEDLALARDFVDSALLMTDTFMADMVLPPQVDPINALDNTLASTIRSAMDSYSSQTLTGPVGSGELPGASEVRTEDIPVNSKEAADRVNRRLAKLKVLSWFSPDFAKEYAIDGEEAHAAGWIWWTVASAVQYNTIITPAAVDPPRTSVDQLCDTMALARNDSRSIDEQVDPQTRPMSKSARYAKALAAWFKDQQFFTPTKTADLQASDLNPNSVQNLASMAWLWQTCSELGYLQTALPSTCCCSSSTLSTTQPSSDSGVEPVETSKVPSETGKKSHRLSTPGARRLYRRPGHGVSRVDHSNSSESNLQCPKDDWIYFNTMDDPFTPAGVSWDVSIIIDLNDHRILSTAIAGGSTETASPTSTSTTSSSTTATPTPAPTLIVQDPDPIPDLQNKCMPCQCYADPNRKKAESVFSRLLTLEAAWQECQLYFNIPASTTTDPGDIVEPPEKEDDPHHHHHHHRHHRHHRHHHHHHHHQYGPGEVPIGLGKKPPLMPGPSSNLKSTNWTGPGVDPSFEEEDEEVEEEEGEKTVVVGDPVLDGSVKDGSQPGGIKGTSQDASDQSSNVLLCGYPDVEANVNQKFHGWEIGRGSVIRTGTSGPPSSPPPPPQTTATTDPIFAKPVFELARRNTPLGDASQDPSKAIQKPLGRYYFSNGENDPWRELTLSSSKAYAFLSAGGGSDISSSHGLVKDTVVASEGGESDPDQDSDLELPVISGMKEEEEGILSGQSSRHHHHAKQDLLRFHPGSTTHHTRKPHRSNRQISSRHKHRHQDHDHDQDDDDEVADDDRHNHHRHHRHHHKHHRHRPPTSPEDPQHQDEDDRQEENDQDTSSRSISSAPVPTPTNDVPLTIIPTTNSTDFPLDNTHPDPEKEKEKDKEVEEEDTPKTNDPDQDQEEDDDDKNEIRIIPGASHCQDILYESTDLDSVHLRIERLHVLKTFVRWIQLDVQRLERLQQQQQQHQP